VPPRRRRKGYQEHHQLDPVLEAALDNEAARLAAIEDPVQAVHAVNEFFNGLENALLRVGEPRLLAIIELYEDLGSYQRVADATELSKTRVGQLVREARRRGL
jgi:DNA-directed RNA polymerase specialized sigma24 family protein